MDGNWMGESGSVSWCGHNKSCEREYLLRASRRSKPHAPFTAQRAFI